MEPAVQAMIDNLPERTGRDLDAWLDAVRSEGLDRHGAIRTWLKQTHGMGHGYANLVATLALRDDDDATDPLDDLFAKRAAMRPVYDAVLSRLDDLAFDIVPKKTAVVWKRSKTFAYLEPKTKRLDIGVQLKGDDGTERLRARKGMTSHVVAVATTDEVDDELVAWLREAWNRCG